MTSDSSVHPADDALSVRDTETVRLIARADAEGLLRLLEDHAGLVRGALRKEFANMLDGLEIDEALSQATHRLWCSVDRFDASRGALRVWFLAIARNCARRILTCKRRHRAMPLNDSTPADQPPRNPSAMPQPPTGGLLARLYQCIDALPPMQRAILLADLAAGGTAPTEELAASLGTSVNSVYVCRNKGRKALRAALAQRQATPEIDGLPAEGLA